MTAAQIASDSFERRSDAPQRIIRGANLARSSSLREENRKLKGLGADRTLDKRILQESLRKKW